MAREITHKRKHREVLDVHHLLVDVEVDLVLLRLTFNGGGFELQPERHPICAVRRCPKITTKARELLGGETLGGFTMDEGDIDAVCTVEQADYRFEKLHVFWLLVQETDAHYSSTPSLCQVLLTAHCSSLSAYVILAAL